VTLVLRSEGDNRNVTFDPTDSRILDLRRELRPDLQPAHLFTGIYFVEPRFVDRIPPGKKLSVVSIFHEMIRKGMAVGGIVVDEGEWRDLGTRAEYLAASASLGAREWIAPSAQIGVGARLRESIVWENGTVLPGANLTRCIVTDGAVVGGTHVDTDFDAE
jgi:mannose-1-phosphate guanylyltransferase